MRRITLRITEEQLTEIEQMVETGEYPNRSEVIRQAVREMLNDRDTDGGDDSWVTI